MTAGEMNELLAGMISMYAPQFGRAATKRAALKLATSSAEDQIEHLNAST